MTASSARGREGKLAAIAVLLACGCSTTALYDGPRRSRGETALIDTGKQTTVVSIDDKPVNGGALGKYEVLPGPHVLVLQGNDLKIRFLYNETLLSPPTSACLETRAGHTYVVRLPLKDGAWRLQIVESDTGRELNVVCSRTDQSPTPALAHAAMASQSPQPGSGFHLGAGFGIGGDPLLTVTDASGDRSTLAAGDGAFFALGGTLMPLWISPSVGLGAGGSIGWKLGDVDATGGSVTISRFPLALWLQSLVAVSERWYISAAAGAQKELRARLGGKGLPDELEERYRAPLGWTGELGAYFAQTWHVALGLGLRYTVARYEIEGVSLDASSIALNLTMHLNP